MNLQDFAAKRASTEPRSPKPSFGLEAAKVLQRLRKASVHIKLSGAYRLAGRSAEKTAQMWCEMIGVKHLLWGSDWPCTNHETEANYTKLFKHLEVWVGNEGVEQVLVRNPSALYWKD